MITDEQARAAAAVWRSKPTIASKYDQAADTLEKWTRQELSRCEQLSVANGALVTIEQAKAAAAYIQSGGEPDDHERLAKIAWDRLAEWAMQELTSRTPPDAGPITAEWCKANGARHWAAGDEYLFDCGVRWSVPLGEGDVLRGGVYLDHDYERGIRNVRPLPSVRTRSQLLALLAALKGGAE